LHPIGVTFQASGRASYAFYMRGLSKFQQISEAYWDQSKTREALSAFREINTRFPKSDYAASAREMLKLCKDRMAEQEAGVKAFLFDNMYRHYKLNRMTSKARRVVRELFGLFLKEPECLPTEWRRKLDGASEETAARIVADYVAGMTDRFALDEHRRLFDLRSS